MRELRCENCGNKGHTLNACIGLVHNVFLRGGLSYNQSDHNLEHCRFKTVEKQDLFNFLIKKRDKRPPLQYSRDLREVAGIGIVDHPQRPWTRDFGADNALKYQFHIYGKENQDEILKSNPAWNHPASIPSQAFSQQGGRSRSRSQAQAHNQPIRNRPVGIPP